jgi:signal transduction histidine kinase
MFDLLDRLLDVVVRVDRNWRVDWANQQSVRLLGDRTGKEFWDLFPGIGDGCRAAGQQAMDGRVPTLTDAHVDRLDRWFEIRFEPVDDGLWVVARDISDRRKIDQRLREENRGLVLQLDGAERRERERIARILHDDLQQTIVAAKLTLAGVLKVAGDAARTVEYSERVLSLLSDAQATTRSLSTELNPVMLQDEGLVAGLAWLAKRMQEKHGLVVDIEPFEVASEVPPDVRILLFDAARECLFNVVKHAGVAHADLEILQSPEATELRIHDQGAGFDPSVRTDETGFGLRAIAHRVNAVGGSVEIQSAPGMGTTVRVLVPCPAAAPSG